MGVERNPNQQVFIAPRSSQPSASPAQRVSDVEPLIAGRAATANLTARVSVDRTGHVLVETGSRDISPATRGAVVRIAARLLGVPFEQVTIALGDTTLAGTSSSNHPTEAVSIGSAVRDCAIELRRRLAHVGGDSPEHYDDALARLGVSWLAADGQSAGSSPLPQQQGATSP